MHGLSHCCQHRHAFEYLPFTVIINQCAYKVTIASHQLSVSGQTKPSDFWSLVAEYSALDWSVDRVELWLLTA